MSPATTPTSRPLLGILLVALATLSFGVGDTVTKHLATHYPLPVVFAVRYLVNVLLLAIILWPRIGRQLWAVDRFVLVGIRALCLSGGTFTMGLALQRMPLGEAVAIVYLAPFAVMLLAIPLLGERVTAIGWLGAAFGFAGVILIARPGGGLDPLGVVYALTNAGLATAYHLLTRYLAKTETTTAMLFHTAWIGAVIFCIAAVPNLPMATPPLADLGFMLLLGTLMTMGHFLFTAAYREAPASQLAPINYLHLVWAGGLSWLVFQHVPDFWALVGMALVTSAGVLVAWGSHAQHRRDKAAVDPIVPPVE